MPFGAAATLTSAGFRWSYGKRAENNDQITKTTRHRRRALTALSFGERAAKSLKGSAS